MSETRRDVDYVYSAGAIEALAVHYFDDRVSVDAIDAFSDFERSLGWLVAEAPELHTLLRRWMDGYMEEELAKDYLLRPKSLAQLLDATFVLLAHYLNDEYPLVIPPLSLLQAIDRPFVDEPRPLLDALLSLTAFSMTFSFIS